MGATTGRRVTAADVARSLGLSRATVGYVLNDTPGQTISERTRQRVLAEATRLGYRPHRAAQDLRRGSSRVVLVVLPDWPMEFRMRRHMEEASLTLEEAGYTLVTCARHTAGRTRPLWELLTPDVVMGLAPFDEHDLASMHACGITKIIPGAEGPPTPQDWPTLSRGPALQIEHLHTLGHRRVAFAATADPQASVLLDARLRLAQRAAARLGLPALDVRPVDHRDTSADDAVRRWHADGVTGVAAYSDDVAATVVGAAIRAGVAVPGELAVIGYGDTPLAAIFVPSVSSVHIDTIGLGRHFAALALHAAEGRALPQRDFDADVTLVPRESTQAAPATR